MHGPHTLNRIVLAIIGAVLVAVSAYGLIRGFDGFGRSRARQPLITPDAVDWLDRNHRWVWPVVALAGVIVALVAFRWLRAQFHSRPGRLDWTVPQRGGTTTIEGSGVASAVHDDLVQLAAVDRADVRLVGEPDQPQLDVRLWVHDDVAIPDVLDAVTTTVTPRLCRALEIDHVPTTVLIDLVSPSRRLR
jgi:hypothetical protein